MRCRCPKHLKRSVIVFALIVGIGAPAIDTLVQAGTPCAPTQFPPGAHEDEFCVTPQVNICNFEICDTINPEPICCRVVAWAMPLMCDDEGPGTQPCIEVLIACGNVFYRPCDPATFTCYGSYTSGGVWTEISCYQ